MLHDGVPIFDSRVLRSLESYKRGSGVSMRIWLVRDYIALVVVVVCSCR